MLDNSVSFVYCNILCFLTFNYASQNVISFSFVVPHYSNKFQALTFHGCSLDYVTILSQHFHPNIRWIVVEWKVSAKEYYPNLYLFHRRRWAVDHKISIDKTCPCDTRNMHDTLSKQHWPNTHTHDIPIVKSFDAIILMNCSLKVSTTTTATATTDRSISISYIPA